MALVVFLQLFFDVVTVFQGTHILKSRSKTAILDERKNFFKDRGEFGEIYLTRERCCAIICLGWTGRFEKSCYHKFNCVIIILFPISYRKPACGRKRRASSLYVRSLIWVRVRHQQHEWQEFHWKDRFLDLVRPSRARYVHRLRRFAGGRMVFSVACVCDSRHLSIEMLSRSVAGDGRIRESQKRNKET